MISATVQWTSDDDQFRSGRYSRKHHWHFDGGVTVPASSSPAVVPLPYSDPDAVDPEEAFVASIASCHMLWFLAIASKAGYAVVDYRDDATGQMGRDDEDRMYVSDVILRPVIAWAADAAPSAEQLCRLHDSAHRECFIANSIKTTIRWEAP